MNRLVSFEDAKNHHPYRYTLDHIPSWSQQQREDGLYYAPQFASDREWYDNTLFASERLSDPRSRYTGTCGATWPLGKSLQRPLNQLVNLNKAA